MAGEGVERGPFGKGERDGEWAASLVASHELSGPGLVVFVEELVAVVLVGDHDQVGERVALLRELSDSLGEVEGKGQADFVASVVAGGRGGHRAQWIRRSRLGGRRRGGFGWIWSSVGRIGLASCTARRGLVRFVRDSFGAEAEAGELGLAEPGHAQPVGLEPVRGLMRSRISAASAW